MIGQDIVVKIIRVDEHRSCLGIEAPTEVSVQRRKSVGEIAPNGKDETNRV
jgi:sRNA-binding carbon storage regulator CsrA